MKKRIFMLAALSLAGQAVLAQTGDSVRMVNMESIQVTATRADAKTPVAYTNLSKGVLDKMNYGRDIPFLLQLTPSVVVTSDAGAGVGYTGIRVRGTDASRISVTTNGVPMNDGESHSLFWVNTPDLISAMGSVQIQRGVGTSTNGAGAFGGSINMATAAASVRPYGEVSGSYGSYNTHRESVAFGTGLGGKHWTLDGRLSNIGSDGYIDRASCDMRSYFGQLGYYGKTTVVKLISFGGKQSTYHAWDGIPKDSLRTNRRYNPCGAIEDKDGNVIGYYDDQKDHYTQFNNQILITQQLGGAWSLNLTGHYTRGDGYYNQYKNDEDLVEYGLEKYTTSTGTVLEVESSDLIRQKKMVNDFGGAIGTLRYDGQRLDFMLGAAWNKYAGYHYGNVSWVKAFGNEKPNRRYYYNDTDKTDFNVFARAEWNVAPKLNIYADMQYRRIRHEIVGTNDKFDWNTMEKQPIDVDRTYDFFNPKGGIYYTIDENSRFYASVAVAHKEPTRNNFTDAKPGATPRAERLLDYELGYNFSNGKVWAGFNFYYMKYKDQLVLTGEVNEIGEALADNVPDSYRRGIELMAGIRLSQHLTWDVNATFSQNKILDYVDYTDDWDNGGQVASYVGTTDLSFSPDVIANSVFTYQNGGFDASFQSSYVGRQYLTNRESKELSLDPYFVSNLLMGYTFSFGNGRSLRAGVEIRNVFNEKYCNNGWGYWYLEGGVRKFDSGWFPQAETNVLANITIRF